MSAVHAMSMMNQGGTQAEGKMQNEYENEGFFDISEFPRMDYEDIFAEPISYKTKGLGRFIHKAITKVFGGAFNYTQSTIYYILVMIIGLFLGFIWGLLFGSLVFIINWIIHPVYKAVFLIVRLVGMIYRPAVRIITDPLCESAGLCFKSIKGSVDVKLPRWLVAGSKTEYEVLKV